MFNKLKGLLFKKEKEVLHINIFAAKHVKVSEYEIKDWLKYSVTREFLCIINDLKKEEDSQVHIALIDGKLEEADRCNAGLVQLKQVLNLPSIMIENAQEEKDET